MLDKSDGLAMLFRSASICGIKCWVIQKVIEDALDLMILGSDSRNLFGIALQSHGMPTLLEQFNDESPPVCVS
jgi:hypothetical protein